MARKEITARRPPRPRNGWPVAQSQIATVVDTAPDGTPITVADRVVTALETGQYVEVAAATAGVSRVTVLNWLRTGASVRARAARDKRDLTEHEAACVDFADRVNRTLARVEMEELAAIRAAGMETQQRRVVVRKVTDGDKGRVSHVEERTEDVLPDWRALAWRAERRWVQRWGRRDALEITSGDDEDTSVDIAGLLAAKLQALRDGSLVALDAGGIEDAEVIDDP